MQPNKLITEFALITTQRVVDNLYEKFFYQLKIQIS
jgi:hypothetical protein